MKQQSRRTAWILWGALLSAQLVYAGLAASGIGPRDPEFARDLPAFLPVLAGVALATAVASHFFWRRTSESSPGMPFAAPAAEAHPVRTSQVLAWVLDESLAIYGLVLAFLGYPFASWALFNASAFVLFLVHRPRAT